MIGFYIKSHIFWLILLYWNSKKKGASDKEAGRGNEFLNCRLCFPVQFFLFFKVRRSRKIQMSDLIVIYKKGASIDSQSWKTLIAFCSIQENQHSAHKTWLWVIVVVVVFFLLKRSFLVCCEGFCKGSNIWGSWKREPSVKFPVQQKQLLMSLCLCPGCS